MNNKDLVKSRSVPDLKLNQNNNKDTNLNKIKVKNYQIVPIVLVNNESQTNDLLRDNDSLIDFKISNDDN